MRMHNQAIAYYLYVRLPRTVAETGQLTVNMKLELALYVTVIYPLYLLYMKQCGIGDKSYTHLF